MLRSCELLGFLDLNIPVLWFAGKDPVWVRSSWRLVYVQPNAFTSRHCEYTITLWQPDAVNV